MTETRSVSIERIDRREDLPEDLTIAEVVAFLERHLGEYGDRPEAIRSAIDYAFGAPECPGGFLLVARLEGEPVGLAVVNRTGMADYIPAHILVYIAVDAAARGNGIGGRMVEVLQQTCDGGVALHVEYDNPARRLYERMGFTSKYAEMRYQKD